jgi:opacity protein-like surface antigen
MPRSRAFAFSTTLLVFALTSAGAHADRSQLPPEIGYNYGDVEDARWTATSGALRAAGSGITSIWGNPAGLAQAQVYHIGALAGIWPEAKRQSYGIGAMDSVTSRLAAGLGFVWSEQDPDGLERESRDLRLALAYPFSPQVSFGLTGRYLYLQQDGLGPLGQSYVSGGLEGEPMLETFSFDAGLRVAPSENFSFGVLGTNLSNPGHGLQPTTAGGGLGIGTRDFFVEADVIADFTTWQKTTTRAMGGAEFLAGGNFPLRLGYRYDGGAASHAISGGLGYIDPAFSVELGARRSVAGDDHTVIVFTIQYFVESSGMTRAPTAAF